MTNDYKQAVLRYLAGKIEEEADIPNITAYTIEIGANENGVEDYLTTELGSTYTIIDSLQVEGFENVLIYGYYGDNGFILVTNVDFEPIQLIVNYDNGTPISKFLKLNSDEKNQIYGIDYNATTHKYRFIMLNNVFGTGIAKLRQSYNLPDEAIMNGYQLTKDPNSSNYLIAGIVFKGNVYQPVVAKLTINVAAENEWTYYEYAGTLLGTEGNLSNIYATWEDGVPDFKMSAYSTNQMLLYFSWYYQEQNLIDVELYDIGSSWTTTTIHNFSSVIADNNTFYYGVHATADGNEKLAIYEISNNDNIEISSMNLSGSTTQDNNVRTELTVINGALLYLMIHPGTTYYKLTTGIYREGYVNMTGVIGDNVPIGTTTKLYEVVNNFNLYKYNYQIGNNLYSSKMLYNPLINFAPHTQVGRNNITDFMPLTMSLYSNDKLLFNRSLYNLVVNGSTTTATVEVPNTMLNNITIDEQNLIGNHYLQITNNIEEIDTNIYETLHINSINTFSMINLDTNVLFPNGSSRLNNSLNSKQDYEDAQVRKIKINYEDGTSRKAEIDLPTYNNGVYTYEFVIFVPKTIENIEIISNDENTTYVEIIADFQVGKFYKINQELTI